jgi:hypothetical protein
MKQQSMSIRWKKRLDWQDNPRMDGQTLKSFLRENFDSNDEKFDLGNYISETFRTHIVMNRLTL